MDVWSSSRTGWSSVEKVKVKVTVPRLPHTTTSHDVAVATIRNSLVMGIYQHGKAGDLSP